MPIGAGDGGGSALAVSGLSKSFGATRALDGVDVAIGRGEVVALLGANGAGKSTLAKIASGVMQPDGGQIVIDGKALRLASPRNAREAGIVTVHQAADQLGVAGISVAENLVLDGLCGRGFGLLAGMRRIRRRAAEVAATLDLDLPLDQDFGALGPAQRQLVAIARAVAAQVAVVILDEPTASLAAAEADRLFEVLDRLRHRGVGILYISHRMGDIRRIADRIVVLRNGRKVAEQARPFDLAEAIRQMIGRDLAAAHRARADRGDGAPVLRLDQVRLAGEARPFDLELREGEIVAVTGALGAGKSRLLGALFGLAPITSGRIVLDGADWRPRGPADAIAGGVFMAGEDRWRSSFLPPLTPGADIAGTIALPHRRKWFPAGLVRRERERIAARGAIDALGIRCRGPGDTLDLLSGGNQQKVVVGRWQAAPCRLLLLDEPFQGVDVGARRDLIEALRSERREAATLIATSDVEEAIEAADTVVVLHERSLVGRHDLRREGGASLLASLGAIEASAAADRGAEA